MASKAIGLILTTLLCTLAARAAAEKSIPDATKNLRKIDGFFPLYWDDESGKLLLEIGRWNQEFLYVASLPAGLGSNDVGLDRGLLSSPRVVAFERVGPRVLLIQKNYSFRASSDNPMEKRAVADSFAASVLWGFDVMAKDGERALVDATEFFQRDMVGASAALARTKQGAYKIDPKRSAFYLKRTKGFPKNSEIEVTLTLVGDEPGNYVEEVTRSRKPLRCGNTTRLFSFPRVGTHRAHSIRELDISTLHIGITRQPWAKIPISGSLSDTAW